MCRDVFSMSLRGGGMVRSVLPVRFTPLRNCARTFCHGTRTTYFNNVSDCCAPFMQLRGSNFQGGSIHRVTPRDGRIPRLIPRLVTPSVRGTRAVLSLFVRGKCGRTSVGLNYPFPLLTGQRGNSNVLPCPSRIGALLKLALGCPRVDFSMGVELN